MLSRAGVRVAVLGLLVWGLPAQSLAHEADADPRPASPIPEELAASGPETPPAPAPGGTAPAPGAPLEAAPADARPSDIVDLFHRSLAAGDRGRALALLSPQLIVFEDGESQNSRGAYGAEHLFSDMEFARSTTRHINRRWEKAGEEQALVVSWVKLSGTFRGLPADREMLETIVLVRRSGRWVIAHIHWSVGG